MLIARANKINLLDTSLDSLTQAFKRLCILTNSDFVGTKIFCSFISESERSLKKILSDNGFSSYNDFSKFVTGSYNKYIHSMDEVLNELYRVFPDGMFLSKTKFEEESNINVKSVFRVLQVSNWTQLTEKFGLSSDYRFGDQSDAEILADVKRVCDDLGRPCSWEEYNDKGLYGTTTISRRFKGIINALLLLGYHEDEVSYLGYLNPLIAIFKQFDSFEREVSFSDLKSVIPPHFKLRFDFKIQDILIEVDGWSHFDMHRYINTYHRTEEDWLSARVNDRRKELYCEKKGIKFLRIKNEESWTEEHILSRISKIKNNEKDEFFYDFSDYDTYLLLPQYRNIL